MTREIRVVLSLAGWWVLVVLPGLLILAGVFDDLGPLAAVCIAGYLAQLAWIMLVVPRAYGHTEMWWLFVASLLPWLVYWAAGYGPVEGLMGVAFAGAVTTVMILLALRALHLDTHGRLVTATVVREIPTWFNTVVNNIYVRRKIELDIPAADGTTYRGVLSTLYEIGARPEPGDELHVRVDPDNPKRYALSGSTAAAPS